ncbi:uncharacterized protein M6B38_354525 [Iris pallida]|uniref:Uncharacterized protein n=1 Tax=Iris pallida TaxID=29817 RepID=A0AAX6GPI8_IRIPA|nr:uncharacterized protein M6B38_354525 [Iris pallida]
MRKAFGRYTLPSCIQSLISMNQSWYLLYQIVEEMRMNMKKRMANRVNPDFQTPVADSSSLMMSSKVSAIREGDNEVHAPVPSTATASLQYVEKWFEEPAVTREMGASTYNDRPRSSSKDGSEAEDDNIILLKKYKSSSSAEAVSLHNSPFSSYERLQLLEKTCSKDYHDKVLRLQNREATDDESSGWHAVEDSSDFEIVDRS